jgi:hypothetical protein
MFLPVFPCIWVRSPIWRTNLVNIHKVSIQCTDMRWDEEWNVLILCLLIVFTQVWLHFMCVKSHGRHQHKTFSKVTQLKHLWNTTQILSTKTIKCTHTHTSTVSSPSYTTKMKDLQSSNNKRNSSLEEMWIFPIGLTTYSKSYIQTR